MSPTHTHTYTHARTYNTYYGDCYFPTYVVTFFPPIPCTVGVDKEANCLVVGLIDFIRTYTWDKQLETWVKASGILGGAGREPTIVSPRSYARRLRGAIRGYFTVVPDGRDVPPPLDPDAA